MVIVGIDGGFVRLGLSAISLTDEGIRLLNFGLIRNQRGEETFNEFLTAGIEQITMDFPRFLALNQPNLIVSETIPVGKLGSSNSQVVAAVTTCHVIAIQQGIPWQNLGANTVKKAVTGDGKASKTLIRNTILDRFPSIAQKHAELKREQKEAGDKTRPGLPQDVFDSVAVALTGAMKTELDEKETM